MNGQKVELSKFKGGSGENIVENAESTGWLNLTAAIDFTAQKLDVTVVRLSDSSLVYEVEGLDFWQEATALKDIVSGTHKYGGTYTSVLYLLSKYIDSVCQYGQCRHNIYRSVVCWCLFGVYLKIFFDVMYHDKRVDFVNIAQKA